MCLFVFIFFKLGNLDNICSTHSSIKAFVKCFIFQQCNLIKLALCSAFDLLPDCYLHPWLEMMKREQMLCLLFVMQKNLKKIKIIIAFVEHVITDLSI